MMPRPYYPVFLDHQLLSSSLGSIKQPHMDKLNVATCAPLPVDNIIIWYGVSFQVKVHLFSINVKIDLLEIVLQLENKKYIWDNLKCFKLI